MVECRKDVIRMDKQLVHMDACIKSLYRRFDNMDGEYKVMKDHLDELTDVLHQVKGGMHTLKLLGAVITFFMAILTGSVVLAAKSGILH